MTKKEVNTLTTDVAKLKTDMIWLKKAIENHLAHHWAVTICLLGITCTEAAALIMLIIKLHIIVAG